MDDDRLLSSLRRIAEPVEPAADFLDRLYESLADELGFHGKPAQAPIHWLGRRGRPRSRLQPVPLWFAAAILLALAVLGGVAVVGALLEHRSAPDLPPSRGAWTTTESLVEGRYSHTATLLPNGRVLVAGGGRTSAELYDPATRSWAATGMMLTGRAGHSATLLPDGRVLVAGGYRDDEPNYVATAELYDPGTGTWTATGELLEGRSSHTATLLPDGTVLVVGGRNGDDLRPRNLSSAEVYDPASGTWTATRGTAISRAWHTATLLADGTVLVAGGVTTNEVGTASAELYDPATRTWTATGAMTMTRNDHTATLLPDGTVLVAGGDAGGPVASAESYDPRSRTWTTIATMTERRWYHTATLLQDGTVLVTGSGSVTQDGHDSAAAEMYDPGEDKWTATASMSVGRQFHAATLLPDGTVLVSGGASPQAGSSAEVYHPGSGR